MAKKTTKRDSTAALYRITQNAYSKQYRVETCYKEEVAGGKFAEHWWDVRGPYSKLSDAQAAKQYEVETAKTNQAKWLPV